MPAWGIRTTRFFRTRQVLNVKSTFRVHRSPPRVCDDRETPLCLGRDGLKIKLIWSGGKRIFEKSEAVWLRLIGTTGECASSVKADLLGHPPPDGPSARHPKSELRSSRPPLRGGRDQGGGIRRCANRVRKSARQYLSNGLIFARNEQTSETGAMHPQTFFTPSRLD